jgi:hypothetical protein
LQLLINDQCLFIIYFHEFLRICKANKRDKV